MQTNENWMFLRNGKQGVLCKGGAKMDIQSTSMLLVSTHTQQMYDWNFAKKSTFQWLNSLYLINIVWQTFIAQYENISL